MKGLVAGPIEISRQADPTLIRPPTGPSDPRWEATQPWTTRCTDGIPPAATEIAISTGKGLRRIAIASLKAPMLIFHGATRGFHNLPKLYGEEVREYENVTDVQSGLRVGAKSFGYGLSDGLRDLVVEPKEGAELDGFKGFGRGLARGTGNAICKLSSGQVNLNHPQFHLTNWV
jgi:hypothetical protein